MSTARPDSVGPPAPLRPGLRDEWMLEPGVAFLNHGSFGAVPRVVFDAQTEWRRRLESAPVEVLARRLYDLIEQAKAEVGAWLGMRPRDFGLVTNATEGINAVLRSLTFRPGDELVTTTHVYNAIRQAMRYVAGRSGAVYREIDVPLPVRSPDDVVNAVTAGLGPRTRLLVVDHITSPTGLVFPVERVCAEVARRGGGDGGRPEVLVDGAHAPGMVPLDVGAVGATYYAGNLHKWACAPKGAGFLWVRPDRQGDIHPAVISHHLGEGFSREFDWQGTRDVSAWLSVPAALRFMTDLGWSRVREHNHVLAAWAQRMLCDRLGTAPIGPADRSMLGSMAAVPLPPPVLDRLAEPDRLALQQRLYTEYQVEAPITVWPAPRLVRVSCQVYNMPAEYERLAEVVSRAGGRAGE